MWSTHVRHIKKNQTSFQSVNLAWLFWSEFGRSFSTWVGPPVAAHELLHAFLQLLLAPPLHHHLRVGDCPREAGLRHVLVDLGRQTTVFPGKKKKNENDDVKKHAGAQFKVKASIGGLQFCFFSLGASRSPRSNETLEWVRFHYPSSRLSACSSPSGIRANSFSLFFSFFFSFLDKVLLKFWITPSFSFSGPLLWLFWQKRGWNEQCPFRCTAFHWYWLLTWRMK